MMEKPEIIFEEYLAYEEKVCGPEGRRFLPSELKYLESQFDAMDSYARRVAKFNMRSGSRFSADVHFLKFRVTRRGILVGFTLGKPYEIAMLRHAVERAGAPYYW